VGGQREDRGHIRRIQPHVVRHLRPYGAYGHRDHIAISQLHARAIVRAADTHRVLEALLLRSQAREKWAAYQAAFKTLTSKVDGTVRKPRAWPDWSITTSRGRDGRVADGVARGAVPQNAMSHLQELGALSEEDQS
jgi:LmbE family N-acetylglucosaminyl deacetylase